MLSDFFVEVGCHKNLQVAMYSVDSLRQLATKFLERDELANYSFQNDFLKPFVIVMRLSRALEIRELIIRCGSCRATSTAALDMATCIRWLTEKSSDSSDASDWYGLPGEYHTHPHGSEGALVLQVCVTDGASAGFQCQVWLEVHVHGLHHCSK